jgi:hypothetical protein
MRQVVDVRVPEWIPVSATRSCPRCGGATGCEVAEDAAAVRCRAVPSERPFAGGGWFHALPLHRGPAARTTVLARVLPPPHAEGRRSDGGEDRGYSPAAGRRRSEGSGSDTRRRRGGAGPAAP